MTSFYALLTIFLVCTATSLQFLNHTSGDKQVKLAQKVLFTDSDKMLLAQETQKLKRVAELYALITHISYFFDFSV